MKGCFVAPDGRFAYYGYRADKSRLEATHTWLDGVDPPDPDLIAPRRVGVRWVEDALEKARIEARIELGQTDGKMPRATEDVIDTLVAEGIVPLGALPVATQQLLARRKALRGAL